MKRSLLALALLLPLLGWSQISFHHYLDSTSTWFNRDGWAMFSSSNCILGGEGERYERHHIIGWDSLDGEAWYQVHLDWDSRLQCTGDPPVYFVSPASNTPSYYLREDSMGNFWVHEGGSSVRKLYEFRPNLTLGDTLWTEYSPCAISLIDTLYLGATPRKRYWCDCSEPWDPQFVIEGIGCRMGLLDTYDVCQQVVDNNSQLVCYRMGSDTLTVTTDFECGRPLHNPMVGLPSSTITDLSLQWSATTEQVILRSNDILPQDLYWQVWDAQGHLIDTGIGSAEPISLSGLAAGVYLFAATATETRQVLRFVKY